MPLTIHSAAPRDQPALWSRQRGSGEDVLLLAGLGDDAQTLAPLADRLARRYRVTVFDARGVGCSAPPPSPWHIADFVADAVTVLDRHGVDHAHLVGTSLGAITAQELAAAHPARVRSLVLDGTWRRSDVALQVELGRAIWTARQESYFVDRRGSIAAARALRRYDAGDRLRVIDAPALLTVGARHAVHLMEHALAVAEQIPTSRVEVIQRAGRRPYLSQPAAYGDLVDRFLGAAADSVEVAAA
jgi:pimeloyl-ACP methyl ester carboxylesterase